MTSILNNSQKWRNRKIIIILTSLSVLFFILGATGLWYATLPNYDGSQTIPGLKNEAVISRDDRGVPHIQAQSEADAMRAMGYVHAQDRLWQMEFFRRVMHGRLSEFAGEKTMPLDRLYRTLGIKQQVEKEVKQLKPDDLVLIQAYCDGVNSYMGGHVLPMEFYLLGVRPQPWTVADALLIPKLLAFGLSWWPADFFLSQMQTQLDSLRFLELQPDYPENGPTIIPDDSLGGTHSAVGQKSSAQHRDTYPIVDPQLLAGLKQSALIFGKGVSNSWVVSGKKSITGKPILANDPHLSLLLPSIFYEVHILLPDNNVYGMSIPGAPGIQIGHNAAIAWGATNAMLDDADLFIEKLNPANLSQYLAGAEWLPLEARAETIRVRGQKPIILEVLATRHGPIISDVLRQENAQTCLAFCWTGYAQGDEIGAMLACNRAKNWDDFRAATARLTAPALNLTYADTAGNIGYQLAGKIPQRPSATGCLPHIGWSGGEDWQGFIPFAKNPSVLNPPQGFIVSANNLPQRNFPHYLTYLWESADRSRRINHLLQADSLFAPEDLAGMQTDVYSMSAERIVPQILACYGPDQYAFYRELRLLGQWDFELRADSEAALLFELTYNNLLEDIFADELAPADFAEFAEVWGWLLINAAMDNLLQKEASPWFDNIKTQQIETKADILKQAFERAALEWQQLNPSKRTWSAHHTLMFKHLLGEAAPFSFMLNRGPFPVGGDGKTIWKTQYPLLKRPFEANAGPVFRQIINLSALSENMAVLAGGQSGHWFTPHYADQVAYWLDGALAPVYFTPEQVREEASQVLILTKP